MTDTIQHQVPNSSGSLAPKLKAPANAADCHIHIYDPRFEPPVEKPQNATVADYRLLQKRLGVSRVVIVQPRNYKIDNTPTVDAAELKRLDEAGIRGIRFTLGNAKNAVVSIDMIEPLAKRIAPYGWHV